MSGPAWMAIGAGVLLDAGLKATVVVGLGALGARALRHRSAAARHAVWTGTLLTLPLLPFAGLARGPEIALDLPGVLPLWAVGALVAVQPLVAGLLALRRLRVEGVQTAGRTRVGRSAAVASPLTWGWWRPTVVLPADADGWEPVLRDAAVAHELAHVRRADWLVHCVATAVVALFWFHPAVWWARSRLVLEAEHAADDAVLATGIAPSAYAELLVRLASGRTPAGALGVGSQVGQRVHAILGERSRSPRRGAVLAAVTLLAALTVPALGAWPTWTAAPETLTCQPAPGVHP